MTEVAVVGGGIAGVAAALRAAEGGAKVRLLEASNRLGGTIRTIRRDGWLLEAGPDSFLTEKPAALELCRALGLEDRVIGTSGDHRRSFIVRDGVLHPTPEGFHLLAPLRLWPFATTPLISFGGKLRALADLWTPARAGNGDESLASFVRRRFGPEMLDRLAQPLVAGIYTADAERLSLRATFPRFLEMEREHGSVIRGLRARRRPGAAEASGARYGLFATLRDGMETLVEAAAARLPAGAAEYGASVTGLVRDANRWRLDVHGGRSFMADAVVLALPAPAAARLVGPHDARLAAVLRDIPCAGSVTVNLGYPRAAVAHRLDGFGFVVPAVEGRRLLACTMTSTKFPGRAPEGRVLLRAFLGGALQPDLVNLSEPDLIATAHAELRSLLGISAEPEIAVVSKHPGAMPQYEVGHLDRVAEVRRRAAALPGLTLAGNAYAGVGLPDCIASGQAAASTVLA